MGLRARRALTQDALELLTLVREVGDPVAAEAPLLVLGEAEPPERLGVVATLPRDHAEREVTLDRILLARLLPGVALALRVGELELALRAGEVVVLEQHLPAAEVEVREDADAAHAIGLLELVPGGAAKLG